MIPARLSRGWIAVLMLAFVACRSASEFPALSPVESFQEGQAAAREALEAFEAGDYPTYLNEILRADAYRPNHPTIVLHTARAYLLNQQPQRALDWLVRYVKMGQAGDFQADSILSRLSGTPRFRRILRYAEESRRPLGQAVVAFTLDDPMLAPEGIAYDPQTGRFFVGGVHRPMVVAVDTSGAAQPFIPEGRDSLWSVLGLAVDAGRRALWLTSTALPQTANLDPGHLGRSGLFRFDADSSTLQAAYFPTDTLSHHFGDLTLAPDGSVYVSDGAAGALYRLRPGGDRLEPILAPGELVSPQGLCLLDTTLYLADYSLGILRVNLAEQAVVRIPAPEYAMLYGIDGLVCEEQSLIAVQNGSNPMRVLRLFLDSDGEVDDVEILEANHEAFDEPTLGTVVDGTFYFVANSPWRHFNAQGRLPAVAPPRILKIELDDE